MKTDAVIDTPFDCRLGLGFSSVALTSVDFLPVDTPLHRGSSRLARRVAAQIDSYFLDARVPLRVPIQWNGTVFRRRVWRALLDIPPGQVKTYGQLAIELGSSARAVGGACRQNPMPLVVPCHRVVAADGDGGFCGALDGPWLQLKQGLLKHERSRASHV